MYCFVRYTEAEDQRVSACSVNIPFEQFKELLINPDCFIGTIMNYIYQEAGIDGKMREFYDLITEEGKLLEIQRFDPDVNARIILGHKMIYYLVYCQEKEMRSELPGSLNPSEDPSVSCRKSLPAIFRPSSISRY